MQILKADESLLGDIHRIENLCFDYPWSLEALYEDIIENKNIYYVVVAGDGNVVGYAGMRIIIDEAHITNVCVLEEYRNKGYGKSLMRAMIEASKNLGADAITLEVRVSNYAAIALYESMGFESAGIRRKYYNDNGEDALIMWKAGLLFDGHKKYYN